ALVYLPSPGWVSIAGWYAALALLPFLGERRWPRIATAGLLSLALALSLWQWVRPGDGKLRVTFLEVGQGDAILVEAPEGPRLLVDGGPGGARRLDVGECVVLPYLWNRPASRLDVRAMTHCGAGHWGGLGG